MTRTTLILLLLLIPVAGAAEDRGGIHVRVVPGLSFAPERIESPAVERPELPELPQEQPRQESGPDVLYFGAAWCGLCQTQKPIVSALRWQGFQVQEIDVDADPQLKAEHGVTSIPAWVVPGGQRLVGAQTEESVRRILPASAADEAATVGLCKVRVPDSTRQGGYFVCSAVCVGRGGDGWVFVTVGHEFTNGTSGAQVLIRDRWVPCRVLYHEHTLLDAAIVTAASDHDLRYPVLSDDTDGELRVVGYPGVLDRAGEYRGVLDGGRQGARYMRMNRGWLYSQVSGCSGGGVYNRKGELVGIQSGMQGRSGEQTRRFIITPVSYFEDKLSQYLEPATRLGASSLPPEAQPSPYPEIRRALSGLHLDTDVLFGDPGCGGDARVLIAAAKECGCRAIGIEIDADRAESARQAVRDAGVEHLVTIIHGDAREVEWEFDVAFVFLFEDMLVELRPKLVALDRFASYAHKVPGLDMRQDGDLWLWGVDKPEQRQVATPQQQAQNYAVWGGRVYHGDYNPGCNCSMCRSIRAQQGIPQPQGRGAVGGSRRGLFGLRR